MIIAALHTNAIYIGDAGDKLIWVSKDKGVTWTRATSGTDWAPDQELCVSNNGTYVWGLLGTDLQVQDDCPTQIQLTDTPNRCIFWTLFVILDQKFGCLLECSSVGRASGC